MLLLIGDHEVVVGWQ